MLFDLGQVALRVKTSNGLWDLRIRNRRIMFPRPPAFLGLTTADYRVQLGMAEWADELEFSLADVQYDIGEADIVAATVPGGTVVK